MRTVNPVALSAVDMGVQSSLADALPFVRFFGPTAGWKSSRLAIWLAFILVALGTAVTANASIIYSIDATITSSSPTGNPAQTDTVMGTLTTDGTIGAIGLSHIVGFDLHLMDDLNAANNIELTPGNSSIVEDTGGALSASATALSFNFSASGADFLIQANSPGPFSGFSYFCFSGGSFACAAGETIAPRNVFADGVILTGPGAPVGVQPLSPSPTAVPEPPSLAVLAIGLLGALGVRRLRARATA